MAAQIVCRNKKNCLEENKRDEMFRRHVLRSQKLLRARLLGRGGVA